MLYNLDEMKRLVMQNMQRSASIINAMRDAIAVTKQGDLLVLSKENSREFEQMFASIQFQLQQWEIVATSLMYANADTVQNYKLMLSDGNVSVDEKIELLTNFVDTALQFVTPEMKEYLEAKRNRINEYVSYKTEKKDKL